MADEGRHYRLSDDASTIEFRAETKVTLESIKEDIKTLQSSFVEYKQGIGQRIENHQDRLARIETSLGIMVKIVWVIVTCSVGVVVAAFYRLILK